MENEIDKGNKQVNNYLRYSGIGFQLLATVVVGFFVGHYLDQWTHTPGPYFTLGSSVLFMGVGFYFAFRGLLKKDN